MSRSCCSNLKLGSSSIQMHLCHSNPGSITCLQQLWGQFCKRWGVLHSVEQPCKCSVNQLRLDWIGSLYQLHLLDEWKEVRIFLLHSFIDYHWQASGDDDKDKIIRRGRRKMIGQTKASVGFSDWAQSGRFPTRETTSEQLRIIWVLQHNFFTATSQKFYLYKNWT